MSPLDCAEITRILPHRAPMLLVDRVTELVPGERVLALKAISAEAPWYRNLPVPDYSYPSCLLVESFAQAAAILITQHWARDGDGSGVPIFGSMSGARFGRPVLPGDVVEHDVHVDRILSDSAIFGGVSRVGGEPVLTVDRMIVALRAERALAAPERSHTA